MTPRPRIALAVFAASAALLALAGCAGPTAPATTRVSHLSPAGKIVTVGDSIMSGHGLDPDQAWPALLAAEDGTDIVNLACSGAGFVAVGSCGDDYAGLITQTVEAHPDVVIIQASSNDIGNSPLSISQATASTVAAFRAALPHVKIIGISTIWNDQTSIPAEVTASSHALRAAIELQDGRYINIGQPLEGHPEWMQSDDVHPTLEGQEAIMEAMRAALIATGVAV